MVEEFLGIRFYKKRSVVDLHEHFLGFNDNKITHQMTFRKKSIAKVVGHPSFFYAITFIAYNSSLISKLACVSQLG
jgi:hypothetical protein